MAPSLLRKGSRNITYWADSSKSKKDSRGQSVIATTKYKVQW